MWRENTRFATLCIYDDTFIGGEGGEPALLVHRTRSMKSSRSVSIFFSLRRPLCLATRNDNAYVITRDFTSFFHTSVSLFFCLGFLQFLVPVGGKRLLTLALKSARFCSNNNSQTKEEADRKRDGSKRQSDRDELRTVFRACVCVCVCV